MGNVCIWVGTEGVLGKLHDLLIRQGKRSWESKCAGNKEADPVLSCWAKPRRASRKFRSTSHPHEESDRKSRSSRVRIWELGLDLHVAGEAAPATT